MCSCAPPSAAKRQIEPFIKKEANFIASILVGSLSCCSFCCVWRKKEERRKKTKPLNREHVLPKEDDECSVESDYSGGEEQEKEIQARVEGLSTKRTAVNGQVAKHRLMSAFSSSEEDREQNPKKRRRVGSQTFGIGDYLHDDDDDERCSARGRKRARESGKSQRKTT